MGKTAALQDRLDEIADAKLDAEIREVAKAITAPLHSGWGNIDVRMRDGTASVTVGLSEVINGLSKAIRGAMQKRRRDEETAQFMNKVDHLGEEIDALRNDVGLG